MKKGTSFLHYLVNLKETVVPKMRLILKVGDVSSVLQTLLCIDVVF